MSKKQKKDNPKIVRLTGISGAEFFVSLKDYEKMKRRAASFKGLNKKLAIRVNTLEESLRHHQGENFSLNQKINAARGNIETKTIQMQNFAKEKTRLNKALARKMDKNCNLEKDIAELKEAIVNQALSTVKPLELGY